MVTIGFKVKPTILNSSSHSGSNNSVHIARLHWTIVQNFSSLVPRLDRAFRAGAVTFGRVAGTTGDKAGLSPLYFNNRQQAKPTTFPLSLEFAKFYLFGRLFDEVQCRQAIRVKT